MHVYSSLMETCFQEKCMSNYAEVHALVSVLDGSLCSVRVGC